MSDDTRRIMAMLGATDDEPSEPSKPRPTMEGQRVELLLRFRLYHQPAPALVPGTLVRSKHGLNTFREPDRHALIFWRYLDRADPVDLARVLDAEKRLKENSIDCLLGIIPDTNDGIALVESDSRNLEPIPDSDIPKDEAP